jgi:hypothetical protein
MLIGSRTWMVNITKNDDNLWPIVFLVLELRKIDWAQIIIHSRYKIKNFADGHVVWLHFKDGELRFRK